MAPCFVRRLYRFQTLDCRRYPFSGAFLAPIPPLKLAWYRGPCVVGLATWEVVADAISFEWVVRRVLVDCW